MIMNNDDKNHTDENTVNAQEQTPVAKKKPPQEVIDKMNRILIASEETGMSPGELEDQVYREMFGMDD